MITMYTSNTCGYCGLAKNYLDEKGVEYEVKNVSVDKDARRELMQKGFMGVPVLMKGDITVQGFDKSAIDKMIAAE